MRFQFIKRFGFTALLSTALFVVAACSNAGGTVTPPETPDITSTGVTINAFDIPTVATVNYYTFRIDNHLIANVKETLDSLTEDTFTIQREYFGTDSSTAFASEPLASYKQNADGIYRYDQATNSVIGSAITSLPFRLSIPNSSGDFVSGCNTVSDSLHIAGVTHNVSGQDCFDAHYVSQSKILSGTTLLFSTVLNNTGSYDNPVLMRYSMPQENDSNRYFQMTYFDSSGQSVAATAYRQYPISNVSASGFSQAYMHFSNNSGTWELNLSQSSVARPYTINASGLYFGTEATLPTYPMIPFPLSNSSAGTVRTPVGGDINLHSVQYDEAQTVANKATSYIVKMRDTAETREYEYHFVTGQFWTFWKESEIKPDGSLRAIQQLEKVDSSAVPAEIVSLATNSQPLENILGVDSAPQNQNRYFRIDSYDENGQRNQNIVYQFRHIRNHQAFPTPGNTEILASFEEYIDAVEDLENGTTYRNPTLTTRFVKYTLTDSGFYFPHLQNVRPHFPLPLNGNATAQIALSTQAIGNDITATITMDTSSGSPKYIIEYLDPFVSNGNGEFFEYVYESGKFWTSLKRYRNDNGSKGTLSSEYTLVDFASIPSYVQSALLPLE